MGHVVGQEARLGRLYAIAYWAEGSDWIEGVGVLGQEIGLIKCHGPGSWLVDSTEKGFGTSLALTGSQEGCRFVVRKPCRFVNGSFRVMEGSWEWHSSRVRLRGGFMTTSRFVDDEEGSALVRDIRTVPANPGFGWVVRHEPCNPHHHQPWASCVRRQ
ncbi:hypothetical protein E3N88_23569 [Mikania micrantha]|uniref:Uncharacterized protein n=1 Tax=Mikania micrantha TaxID=192012 RepID=A0A5N6NGA9_9ASTR|nr:hypothetical protein E3N88_23569 [Mikania micrantha]